jgi:hypothetical protein
MREPRSSDAKATKAAKATEATPASRAAPGERLARLLPRDIREAVFEPALQDLLVDHLRRREPGDVAREARAPRRGTRSQEGRGASPAMRRRLALAVTLLWLDCWRPRR